MTMQVVLILVFSGSVIVMIQEVKVIFKDLLDFVALEWTLDPDISFGTMGDGNVPNVLVNIYSIENQQNKI